MCQVSFTAQGGLTGILTSPVTTLNDSVNSRRSDSAGRWALPGTVTQGNLW